jgi:glycosyltransferase involved in cell wall biosynthesis
MTARRITIVATELLGRPGTGGAGTADSLLAVALGRHGHEVQLLRASGRVVGPLSPEWAQIYESAGVAVRMLDAVPGVRPAYLAPTVEVFHALRERPPDVVVADDWRGLAYAALQARHLGLALHDTAFVTHCHGPSRVLAEFARKVPDRLARFGQEVAERTSIGLADAVVSPSAWLLDWMRAHGWPVPESTAVIQYVRESTALDREPARAQPANAVRRLAFFGQLREGKGIRIFLTALDALEPELLHGIELVFLGVETARWPANRIASSAPAGLAAVDVLTSLDRHAALAELRKPGTLAVMPSLLDNSPNTVSECIEHGIPFVAARTGGIPELVAEEDRARVLCEPTADDLAAALRRALGPGGFAPARPAREARASLDAWLELVDSIAPSPRQLGRRATHVAVVASGEASAGRAQQLAQHTRTVEVEVISATSRRTGLTRSASDWVVFLDDQDTPDDAFIDTLVAAQAASDADVVTAGVRPAGETGAVQLFLGNPGALGLVENQYGVVGLVRSELAAAQPLADGGVDPDWPLFARLALAGARIVSIPEPLAGHAGKPGEVVDVPGEGLAVLDAFEEKRAADLPDLPQLAATLAAAHARLASAQASAPAALQRSLVRRALRAVARRRPG